MAARRHRPRPGLREVWALWGLYGLAASSIFATYSRLPVGELYHVSRTGRSGGAGRVLVFLNFSTALAAIAIVAVVAAAARRRPVSILGVAAVLLCAAVFWPGVVDQNDLDARWVNAIPAAGVLLVFALTVGVTVVDGIGPSTRVNGDRARSVAALVLFALALPWLAAEAGFLIGRWPGFGSIYYSDEWYASFGHARLHPAVHPGHHHGLDGALLAATALLLSRVLGRIEAPLRTLLGVYLALLSVYGLANLVNDFWFEQIVKRGVTSREVPSLLVPSASVPWLLLLALTILGYALLFRYQAPAETIERRRRLWPGPWAAAAVALVVVGLVQEGSRRAVTPMGSVPGIAFVSAPSGTSHIYVTTRAGAVQLTHDRGSDLAPAWARDGRLLFQSNREGDTWELYSRDPGGGGVRRLTKDGGAEGEPAPSPDGRRIAFIRDGDLYVMSAAGTGARKVADDAAWPTWSADGRALAYEARVGGHRGVVVTRPGPGLGEYGTPDHRRPAWSPRGSEIAYECLVHHHWHICLIDPRAPSQRLLTHGDANEFAPAWSPDGRRIAFIGDRDGNDQLYVMGADGTGVVRLTSGQAHKDTPAWRP